jgi:ribose transport system permease protein
MEAARCAGIRIGLYTVLIYALNGALTGLSGMIESARLVTGQPTAGTGYELNVIAAVVIGGGSLNGGQGTVIGTVIGAMIMGLLSNGCNLLGVSPFMQQIIIGTVIILAVSFDEYQRRRMA